MFRICYILLSCVIICLPFFGCDSQSSSESVQTLTEIPGNSAEGQQIPWPVAQASSVLTDTQLDGVDVHAKSANAVEQGTTLQLGSAGAGFEWAIYRFDPGTEDLDSAAVLLDIPEGSEAWIGLADYVKQHWVFCGPYSASKTLAVDEECYHSSGEELFLAVVVYGGDSAIVRSLCVRTTRSDNQAPWVDLAADQENGDAPLAVSFDASNSIDPDGELRYFMWDFDGDGNYEGTTFNASVNHVYNEPGLYQATVAAVDDLGAWATDYVSIDVGALGNANPVAVLTATPDNGDAPLVVTLDASGSSDAEESIARYDYDFDNDGIWDAYDAPSSVVHTYDTTGVYTAKVRITDSAGAQDTTTTDINVSLAGNISPTAALTATPDSGYAPLNVTLDASGSNDADGSIVRYDYDFNSDGIWDAYDAASSISHTYASAGIFTAKVRVTDDAGAQDNATADVTVNTVGNTSPTASLSATPSTGSTPLATTLDASASSDSDGTIVRYDYDFDSDGIWDAYDAASSVSHTYSLPGAYTATVRVTDDDDAQDVDDAVITVLNTPPQAILFAVPQDGEPSEAILLNGSCSSDPDGYIVKYEWDLDNDSVYEIDSGLQPQQQTQLPSQPGHSQVAMRVTDNLGAMSTSSQVLTAHGWVNSSPNAAYFGGSYTSLNLVNGLPAISYFSGTDNMVEYIQAANVGGTSWNMCQFLGSSASSEAFNSLAVVNGRPAVCFYDFTCSSLRYIRAGDQNGASWGSATYLDSFQELGLHNSMTIVNGYPAVGYCGHYGTKLRYIRANDQDGASWASPVQLVNSGTNVMYSSLAVVNGNPAISFCSGYPYKLYIVRATDASGSAWGAPAIVDNLDASGKYNSLAVVNDNPAIAYYTETGTSLRYIRASNADGTAWNTPLVLDSTDDVGMYASLTVIDGIPAISYYDNTHGDLRFIEAIDANGTSWSSPITLSGTDDIGSYCSLMEIESQPMISCYNATNHNLAFFRRY